MYFFRLRSAGGKRLTKSLETKNAVVAAKRARQALEELQSIVDSQKQQCWRADEPGVEWRDLVNEAITIRKRKKGGADYSPAWYTNTRIAMDKVPFQFEEATPKVIRAWMHKMQAGGLGGCCSGYVELIN